MNAALQRRVQRYGWDKAASYYEQSWQQQLKLAQDKTLELADIQPGEKLLDIACGTGLVSFPAAEKAGSHGSLLGIDISEKMILYAQQQAAAKALSQVRFERMDAESLNVNDGEYDAVLCALGLMYFPDPQLSLKEMYRVLKPGGRAAVAVWGRRNACGWADIFQIADKRVSSEVCPMFFQLGQPGMLRAHLVTAGFRSIITTVINTELIYTSDTDACLAAFAGGPVALAYHKFSEGVKKEVHEEYLQSIADFKKDNEYKIPGEFVVALGIK